VASQTQRLHIELVELTPQGELAITSGADEMIDAEGLIQSGDHISGDRSVADETHVSEQLIEMGLAVREIILLVIAITVEGFLTLGTTEVVDVELLSEGVDDSFIFDGLLACATDGNDAHLVVAT